MPYQHGSGTNRGYFGGRGAYGYDPKNIEQDSGEVRYAADPASPVKWIVGLYHYEYSQYTFSEANAEYGSQAGFSRNRGISNAVFGQVTVPVTDSLRLIGGVRQSWDKRRARGTDVFGNIVGGKIKGDFFDYRAGLEADLSPTSLAYFTASSAFRPGGVNAFDGSPFKPERLHSYEAGIKNRFLDNRLQINASGFYYDYKDYQVVDFFIGAAGPNLVFYNVDATNYGLELDAQAALTVDDTVNVSVSYLHSKIDGDLILHPADPFTAVNFKGERLPHAPAWTVKGGYQHVFDLDTSGSVTARVDGRYVSKQFVAPNNTSAALQKGYATADASISWESADKLYGFTVFARNIADKAVKTGYFVGYNTVGAPRTYGATARVSF
ncbi:TonB-dependent receptor [Novosphingobium olei]|uniref:TonB-dependent receptor n=1 Tax=Novosphingobium olei TaxID=2728851 RepID=UPI001F0D672D|nr:TonB-dependent receptor [Novosphingobium olei]